MRIFVGSSSQADKSGELKLVVKLLKREGLIPIPWSAPGTFMIGTGAWETLLKLLDEVDAAAFIFREDDFFLQSDKPIAITRDNVILEFGLFSGRLGAHKCAMFLKGKPLIPSDLKGITYMSIEDISAAKAHLHAWATGLREEIREPYYLNTLQIEAIAKAMSKAKIPGKNISSLMRQLGVLESEVDAALGPK